MKELNRETRMPRIVHKLSLSLIGTNMYLLIERSRFQTTILREGRD